MSKMKNKMGELSRAAKDAVGGAGGGGPAGNVLGSVDPSGNRVFDATFTRRKLGMTVSEERSGEAVVTAVESGSEAAALGVRAGDAVAECAGAPVADYGQLVAALRSGGRPLTLRFLRPSRRRPAGSAAAAGAGAGSAAAPAAAAPRSAGADAAREARLAAAEARAKRHSDMTRAKPKRKSSGAAARPVQNNFDRTDAHAQQVLASAKASEQREIAEMGYNPFKAHMSSSDQARAGAVGAAVGPAAAPAAALPRRRPRKGARGAAPVATEAQLVAVVNDAAALLQSAGDAGAAGAAVRMLTKLLRNVRDKAGGDAASKFRRIRLSNEKIAASVLGVDGGLEMLVGAGFEKVLEDGGEEVLYFAPLDTQGHRSLGVALERLAFLSEVLV